MTLFRRRAIALFIGFMLAGGVVLARLAVIQVSGQRSFNHARYAQVGGDRCVETVRGGIYTRWGTPLAEQVPCFALGVHYGHLGEDTWIQTAASLCEAEPDVLAERAGEIIARVERVRDAVREVCDYMGERGLVFALETGQESPKVLRDFIAAVDRPNLKVNFDMANLVLYGSGRPLPALEVLIDLVDGTHCKDGIWPSQEGRLGTEVPLGKGEVGVEEVVKRLYDGGYRGPLDIEREIEGEEQRLDIVDAIELLRGIRARILGG